MQDEDRSGPTNRTRVRRIRERGRYDRETIYRVLDDALIGHVGFVADAFPHVIPMLLARRGNDLLLHGSAASRLMRLVGAGAEVCVSVTHLDGVVVARSVFDSSMNYRSVVIFGRAFVLTEREDKLDALRTVVEHVIPGRWEEARQPTEKELRATTVLSLALDEASAKVRSGPPQDDESDVSLRVWAGEIPIRMVSLAPVPDPLLHDDVAIPDSVRRFRRDRIPSIEEVAES